MGGLSIRAWLKNVGGLDRIHRVVTVGTPHRGTLMARRSGLTNIQQMRIDSPWLAQLSASESPQTYAAFTCFWSRCDNIVFPTESATLPGAANRHLAAMPHVGMAYHPEILAEVLRLVQANDLTSLDVTNPLQGGAGGQVQ
jgi:triacylglycerol esterase/lipase EstA (alpha/beta hydrolase family)